MKKLFIASLAATAFCGAPVLAADLPTKAPVYRAAPVELFNWTGCYIGANTGGASSRVKVSDPDGFVRNDTTGSGWVGGGQIGCDYQVNSNWVFGIQGIWDASGIRTSAHPNGFPFDTSTTKVTSFGTVAAELGYLINPTLKFYGKAGLAWVDEKASYVCSPLNCDPAGSFGSKSYTRTAFDAGLGLTWMFQRNWDLFVEYDHMWIGNYTRDITVTGFPVSPTVTQKIQQGFNKVLVGINYRFDWGKSPVVAKY
jgi:outer membrane immunogenic protein